MSSRITWAGTRAACGGWACSQPARRGGPRLSRGELLRHQIEQEGTTFSSRIISEGTLRMLALCVVAVTADSGLVAFEEPENGVQPQRRDRIADLLASIGRRSEAQLILTTHSPGFAAAVLERSRADDTDIGLFGVSRDGSATRIRRLPDPGLWEHDALDDLLREPAEEERLTAVLRRGWLDA